jgi:hypothetical protein
MGGRAIAGVPTRRLTQGRPTAVCLASFSLEYRERKPLPHRREYKARRLPPIAPTVRQRHVDRFGDRRGTIRRDKQHDPRRAPGVIPGDRTIDSPIVPTSSNRDPRVHLLHAGKSWTPTSVGMTWRPVPMGESFGHLVLIAFQTSRLAAGQPRETRQLHPRASRVRNQASKTDKRHVLSASGREAH